MSESAPQSPPPKADPLPIALADIRAAGARIAGAVAQTPCTYSRTLSKIAGADVWLKFENLQFTASFKERGALNRLLALSEAERAKGVIAMSAGNHAQGVAYHAQRLGIPATIVMPSFTPITKVQHTEEFGARVMLKGETLAEAGAFAQQLCREEGLTFIHPYDDDKVIAGQGTVALEMLEAAPELDTLIVPIGGGGLICGMAIAAKAVKPDIRLFGVESELYPGMARAMGKETGPSGGSTVAEGIAVEAISDRAKTIVARLVDDVLLVGEAEIEHALTLLLDVEKTLAEGAGAVGLAALLKEPARFAGRKVGLVLSGGNIDPRILAQVILRELSRAGRISTFHVELTDRPGSLAKIATVIGDAGGNIIEVLHNRLSTDLSVKNVAVDITVETRDAHHRDAIGRTIADAGFRYRIAEA